MKKYVSHKTVSAAKISAVELHHDGSARIATDDGRIILSDVGYRRKFQPADGKQQNDGDLGYYIRYEDGYESWSPSLQFESGYTAEDEAPAPVTPVKGYQPQPQWKLDTINAFKEDEERILRRIENWQRDPKNADGRWLAIARTHFEQAYMALNRAIFQPQRIRLPEDVDPATDLDK